MSTPITSVGGDGREYVLVDEDTGAAICAGEKREGMRDTFVIDGGRAPQHAGSTGRVWTDKGEFFPGVVNAKWKVIS